jgi:hypothetical protein
MGRRVDVSDLDDVRQAVALMRELGMTKLRSAGMEIELGPAPEVPVPPPKEEPDPVCACGHPHDEHNASGCLQGCAIETCAGSGQHPQPEEGA